MVLRDQHFSDINGRAAGELPTGGVLVPGRIELEGDSLRWELAGPARWERPNHEALNGFLRLHSAAPEAILAYAKKWGTLRLDAAGRPCAEGLPSGFEPLSIWRHLSRRAVALLNIARAADKGQLGAEEEWRCLAAMKPTSDEFTRLLESPTAWLPCYVYYAVIKRSRGWPKTPLENVRDVIASDLNAWLSVSSANRLWGRSDFRIVWNKKLHGGGGWELQIDHHGFLFQALALQLAMWVCRARGVFQCSGCLNLYIRTKDAPRRGPANFCDFCGKDAADRAADVRRREKMVQARQLREEGRTIADIAKELKTKPACVRRWLKKMKRKKR